MSDVVRDTVWRRSDGMRVRMHMDLSADLERTTMTLTPFGAENDGASGEEFVLIGSVPVEVAS